MNWDSIEGNWQHMKDRVKAQWDKLTDDHLEAISGKREHLVCEVEECYGIHKDEAERQVSDWESRNPDVFAETAAEVQKHVGIARQ